METKYLPDAERYSRLTTDELRADRTYYARQADSIQSQVGENEAQLRYEQRQTEDQIQQARATLETAVAQTGEARAELENAKIMLDTSCTAGRLKACREERSRIQPL